MPITGTKETEQSSETVRGPHFSRHVSPADVSAGKAEVQAGIVRGDGSEAVVLSHSKSLVNWDF